MRKDPQTVTRLLRNVGEGDSEAVDALLPLVYEELHGLADRIFQAERGGHTLQPTALVHEAWLKLTGREAGAVGALNDRRHFFAVAASAMRQVLADHARRAKAQKRGDGRRRVTLDDGLRSAPRSGIDVVELDDSLAKLAGLNSRHARVVELRVLGGLTIAEAAEVLGVSHSTIEADWFTAKAWLRKQLA